MDTQGLLLGVTVTAANISDREGGKVLLRQVHLSQPQWSLHLFVDGGYAGPWEAWVKTTLGFSVEVVRRADANTRGYWLPVGQELTEEQIKTFRGYRTFKVLRKRWVVAQYPTLSGDFVWDATNRWIKSHRRDDSRLNDRTSSRKPIFTTLHARRPCAFFGQSNVIPTSTHHV